MTGLFLLPGIPYETWLIKIITEKKNSNYRQLGEAYLCADFLCTDKIDVQ